MRNNITKQPAWSTILIYTILLGLLIFRTATGNQAQTDIISLSPMGHFLDSITFSATIYYIISAVIITLNGILIMQIISKHGLALIYAPLPMILYIIIGFFIAPQSNLLNSAILSLLTILALNEFFSVFQKEIKPQKIFASNFIIGITALLYPPILPFAIVFGIMATIFHLNYTMILVSIAGLIAPILISSWCWWISGEPFYHIGREIVTLTITPSQYSILETFSSGYFLNGTLALSILICIIFFVLIKKSISFSLLITAKYIQDCLVILLVLSVIELWISFADGAIFPILGVISAPMIYQLYSKQEGNFPIISYYTAIVLAISVCII